MCYEARAMRFEIKHEFDHPRDQVEAAMLHADFPKFLLEKHGVLLEVEPKERTENDREIKRKVRYRPKPVISSIGPKKVPPEWFAFIESSTWDRSSHSGTFTNTPTTAQISSMLLNTGTIRLRDAQKDRDQRKPASLVA